MKKIFIIIMLSSAICTGYETKCEKRVFYGLVPVAGVAAAVKSNAIHDHKYDKSPCSAVVDTEAGLDLGLEAGM